MSDNSIIGSANCWKNWPAPRWWNNAARGNGKIFFRMIWLIIIGFILFSLFMRNEDKAAAGLTGAGHSAVITLEGVIDSQTTPPIN